MTTASCALHWRFNMNALRSLRLTVRFLFVLNYNTVKNETSADKRIFFFKEWKKSKRKKSSIGFPVFHNFELAINKDCVFPSIIHIHLWNWIFLIWNYRHIKDRLTYLGLLCKINPKTAYTPSIFMNFDYFTEHWMISIAT